MSRSTISRVFEVGLWLTAFVCLGWVALAWLDSMEADRRVEEALADARASESSSASPSSGTTPATVSFPELAAGDPIGRIRIPDIDLDAAILESDDEAVLHRAVGHLSDTPLPGAGGVVALAGHRDTFFRNLRHVEVGQRVELETRWGPYTYEVRATRVVEPEDLWVLEGPVAGEVLTLVTCHPFDFVGPAPDRFIVWATRVSAPRSASGPAPGSPR